jgi:hypothetical protein
MSTVHSIHLVKDVVKHFRRRPRVTFTNAKNVRDVFLYHPRLDLFIPLAIDNYNHHINEADVANQRRKHLITQRKHNLRNWRPLWHWLLDIILTNCFILWKMQARRKDPKANWDPVEFNRALVDSLMIYNPSQARSSTANQVIINSVPTAIETVQASQKKNTVIQREIGPQRVNREVLLGVSKKVEKVTNVRMISMRIRIL